ncbi:DEKNAAC100825 [Brettanomyces naardenensis]|uniref:V-type proton ATPase subunit H n=1 Tax=Brettanomyces naardenensis TaxID=13370 RepID=A0A448YFD9_BRENA|nr:DEKNAAC100825 [Brettanomyces naardenensis]
MTVELQFPQFKLEGDTINDILINARSRTIAWGACVKANYLSDEEANYLKKVSDCADVKERVNVIVKDADIYAEKMVSLLSSTSQDDIIRFVLVCMIDTLVAPNSVFPKQVLGISHLDPSLPYAPLVKLLDSKDESIRLCSAYVLTLLLTSSDAAKKGNEKTLLPLYNFITSRLLKSANLDTNFDGLQLLKELLQVKLYRDLYWSQQKELFPALFHIVLEKKGELQMKYYATFSIWLLTFIPSAVSDLNEQYPAIIETLYAIAKDAVKEKIVRLAIDSLLNLLNIPDRKDRDKVVKHYLLANGLEITKQLLERKWADEELKQDLNAMLDTLNDAVATLTTFDEYANELTTKTLLWSPSHKSEEFWYENIDKFKENNWRLLKEMVALLDENTDDQKRLYQNQAIVCYDISQLIKGAPETAKQLDKIGAKGKIMNLMNSPNSNVKYEALRTTQQLVAMSL